MPFVPITIAPTAVQTAAVNTAIASIEANEPYKANLSGDEKGNYPTVADERYPFVVKAIKDLAPLWVSKMAPRVGAGLAQAQVSLQVVDTYRAQWQRLLTLVEFFGDAKHVAGFQCMEWLGEFYAQAKALKAAGEPGADTLVEFLAPLFAKAEATAPAPGPV